MAASAAPTITVYKSKTCGCCNKWVEHLRANGFRVEAKDVLDIDAVKREHGIPPELGSCHTAVVGGYVVEGHVPAEFVAKMLRERPSIKGLAVPRMPIGSPGMEGSYVEPYDVIALEANGHTNVYASIR